MSGIQAFRSLVKGEGVLALFKGVVPPLAGLGALNSVLFSSYGPTLAFLERSRDGKYLENVFWAGCVGGTAQSVIACPLELLKIRMQTEVNSISTLKACRMVIQQSGVLGLYRGMIPTLIRDCPSYGVWFVVYEFFKEKLVRTWGLGGKSEPVAQFFSGGLAGVVAWASIYPVDVVKSRVQSSVQPLSMASAFRDGWKQGGMRSFFQGFSTTIAKGFVCSGTTFVCVELVMLALGKM
jgi:solute carrier family 25 carnitine/acylcarnitine transporter 20/29